MADTAGKLKRRTRRKPKPEQDSEELEELADMLCVGLGGEVPSAEQIRRVQSWLAANPSQIEIAGDLANEAIKHVIECETTWLLEREGIKLRQAELRVNLGYEASNHIERMLIDQAVLCWTRLYFLEKNLATATKGSHNRESGFYWDRRVTSAQHRYNQALISLAKVRKLKLPDITAIQAQVAIVNASDGGPVELQAKRLLPTKVGK